MMVKVRALTPIWTGDVDRRCGKIKETGIIGSLRWWYEALIRGLGGYACDPTSEESCKLDQKKFQKAIKEGKSIQEALDEQICPACQLFGCTGWSRRFRLEVTDTQVRTLFFVTSLSQNKWWLDKIWEKQNEVAYGDMHIKIDTSKDDIVKRVLMIIWLISKYGGIGARTHMGFGQIAVEGLDSEKSILFKEIEGVYKKDQSSLEYNLSNFFVLKFKIPEEDRVVKYYLNKPKFFVKTSSFPYDWESKYIPCSFDIKYHGKINDYEFGLREYFKKKLGRNFARELFGYSEGEDKHGGRIFVSHLYKENKEDTFYYLKIWAFLPSSLKSQFREIKDGVNEHIKEIFEEAKIIVEETGENLIKGLRE